MLRPAGTAKFGDRYVDVVTEGDFIPPGTSIQVVEVEGTRIVVKHV
jgi:membrane-bound serine protease (ClpP class)